MPGWERITNGSLAIYQTSTLAALPGVVHGFTTRRGGISKTPYATFNLGSHVEDNKSDVQANRQRLWKAIGYSENQVALAEQVHGRNIVRVSSGCPPVLGADAIITNRPDLLLMLLFADCVPIYLVDSAARAIGLVHAGWRGTAAEIVPGTVTSMQENFGSQPEALHAAIGPCIGKESYEVGAEVAKQFTDSNIFLIESERNGSYSLDLRRIIFDQLLCAGLTANNIAVCSEDTFSNAKDFFSYRRDGRKSGRMAAFLALN